MRLKREEQWAPTYAFCYRRWRPPRRSLALAQAPPEASPAIEEIVVVAQKREQLIQDVGIAVTAFSGRNLRERDIDQSEDLYQLIPNVNLQNNGGGGAPVVIVRGVGLQSFRINDSPTTAFYVDDVYQTSVASAEWTMFDLERVEVLKGPQGGLYGRNALGGAIQIISRTPSVDEASNGYVSLGFEEYSREELEAAASFAIGDKFAIRVAGRDVDGSDAPYRSVTGGYELRRRGPRRGAESRCGSRRATRSTSRSACTAAATTPSSSRCVRSASTRTSARPHR